MTTSHHRLLLQKAKYREKHKQEAQLSQRGRAMLRVIEYFAKSYMLYIFYFFKFFIYIFIFLKVSQGHSK